MQAKITGKASSTSCVSSEYEDCVPMVDKAVDVGWNSQNSSSTRYSANGQ